MRLHRVFPYDVGAAPTDRGGALFVPAGTGFGRIDNPELYSVLYVASSPSAAIAESFGRFAVWRPSTFVHESGAPYAVVTYEAPDDLAICDLDDVDTLRSIGVTRPSTIVTRDRAKTQAWARTIFALRKYAGACWWSFYDPNWPVMGLWDSSSLHPIAIDVITSTDALVRQTAADIVRQIAER